jgi:hypothetical protein
MQTVHIKEGSYRAVHDNRPWSPYTGDSALLSRLATPESGALEEQADFSARPITWDDYGVYRLSRTRSRAHSAITSNDEVFRLEE